MHKRLMLKVNSQKDGYEHTAGTYYYTKKHHVCHYMFGICIHNSNT